MPILPVKVSEKIAIYTGNIPYVCHNDDYVVHFTFSEEWNSYPVKTARFVYGTDFIDVPFEGNVCSVPLCDKAQHIGIGVFAGNLLTTTGAIIPAEASIRSGDGTAIEPPSPEQYDQIMEMINQLPAALHAAENAQAAEQKAKTHTDAAEKASISAVSSAVSASLAQNAAENAADRAEQAAEGKGYIVFELDNSDGKLYLIRSDGLADDVDFTLNENTGELEVIIS